MPWSKGYITAFCLVTSWPLFALSAEETRDDVNTQAKVSQQAESDDVPWWLSSHETVSKTIGNWSTNIDSF